MRIVGFDLGVRKYDAFVLDAEGAVTLGYAVKKSTVGEECSDIAMHLENLMRIIEVRRGREETIFVVEDPVLAGRRNLQTYKRIAMTAGVVHGMQFPSYSVSVSSWKKATVGSGNASKDEVKAWLDAHYPDLAKLCAGKQDLYDAAAIALYGRQAMEAGLRLSQG